MNMNCKCHERELERQAELEEQAKHFEIVDVYKITSQMESVTGIPKVDVLYFLNEERARSYRNGGRWCGDKKFSNVKTIKAIKFGTDDVYVIGNLIEFRDAEY